MGQRDVSGDIFVNPKTSWHRGVALTGNILGTLRLLREAVGGWAVVWGLLLLVQGALPALTIYLTRQVVDGFVEVVSVGAGWTRASPVLRPLALMGLVTLASLVTRSVVTWVRELQKGELQDHISRLIHHKSGSVRMQFYDFPEFHDHLYRARDEAR